MAMQAQYGLYPHQRQVANDLLSHLDSSGATVVRPDRRRVVARLADWCRQDARSGPRSLSFAEYRAEGRTRAGHLAG